jgi:hypothetical protein
MPHLGVTIDGVVVPASVALPDDEPCVDQVGQDPLGGAFRDADPLCHVPEPDVRVAGDAEQHLRVVREEPPGTVFGLT